MADDYETQRLVPRVVEAKTYSELFTMAHLILSTPCPLKHIDAILVVPGLGEDQRLHAAIKAWESNPSARHFLVAGTNGIEKTQQQPDLDFLRASPFNLKRTEGVETQVSAEHTRDQALWLAGRLKSLNIKSAAFFVTHWHLPRAYMTLLKALLDQGIKLPVCPVAVPTPPSSLVPEYNETVVAMSAGEAERIKKYQELGHVTSLKELTDYLDWLWQQSPELQSSTK